MLALGKVNWTGGRLLLVACAGGVSQAERNEGPKLSLKR